MKAKFRASKQWKQFREHMKANQDGKCYVTGAKLTRTANLHHKDMDMENYEDISNEHNFVFLSKKAHEMVHWLWGKGHNDWRSRLARLEEILIDMDRINNQKHA